MLWKNRTLGTAETNDHSKYPSPHFTAFAGVLTGALRDPESVADAGQGGDGDEDADEVAVWNPDEQKDEQAELEDCRDADQRLAGDSTRLEVSRSRVPVDDTGPVVSSRRCSDRRRRRSVVALSLIHI